MKDVRQRQREWGVRAKDGWKNVAKVENERKRERDRGRMRDKEGGKKREVWVFSVARFVNKITPGDTMQSPVCFYGPLEQKHSGGRTTAELMTHHTHTHSLSVRSLPRSISLARSLSLFSLAPSLFPTCNYSTV